MEKICLMPIVLLAADGRAIGVRAMFKVIVLITNIDIIQEDEINAAV